MGIIARLPKRYGQGDLLPSDLSDSTLVAIGTAGSDNEAGDFVIEYRPKGSSVLRRLVLLFDECGMWIEENTTLDVPK